jgi:hypothetical protein
MTITWQGKHVRSSTRNLGILALFYPLLERMNVRRIIDAHVPKDSRAEFSCGDVLSLLIAARLCHPSALVHVPEWAEESAADVLWGIPPEKLNDDRLGRALDRFFPVRHAVLANVALHVAQEFDVPLEHIHYDPTHVLFAGEYESAAERPSPINDDGTARSDDQLSPAHITKGRATDDAPLGALMVHVGLATLVDQYGPLPIFGHTIDGNQNGRTGIHEFFCLFCKHLKPPTHTKLRWYSDRGTMSVGHLLRLRSAKFHGTCSAPWGEFQPIFVEHRKKLSWRTADYLSIEQRRRRDEKSSLPQEHYELASIDHELVDDESRQTLSCRLIFVFSTADQKVARKQRGKQIDSCRTQLEKIRKTVAENRNKHAEPEAVGKRLNRVLSDFKGSRYFKTKLLPLTAADGKKLGKPAAGCRRPTHCFEFQLLDDQVASDESHDGYSVLVTTIPSNQASIDTIFAEFKNQNYCEHVNAQFKGPVAVRPVYLKSPQRVESLIMLLMIALTAYFLIQRTYRHLAPKNAPWAERRKTTRTILRTFASYSLIINKHQLGQEVCTTELRPRQLALLRALEFPTPNELLKKILPPIPN